MKRLSLVPVAILVAGLLFAVACGAEKVVEVTVVREVPVEKKVVETVVVEKLVAGEKVVETVVVEKLVAGEKVIETVVVEKEVAGEKVVETVVVEKEVEKIVLATATPAPMTFYGLPMPTAAAGAGTAPPAKTPAGTVIMMRELNADMMRGSGVPGEFTGAFAEYSITEKLFTTDESGNAVALVAESWTVAEDQSSIEVTLKSGIPWHSGPEGDDFGELTAADFAWSFNQANPGFNPASVTDGGGAWSSFLGQNEITVVDEHTVHIPVNTFDVRWQGMLFGQSGLNASLLCKAAYDRKGEDWVRDNIIGTGPFEVVSFASDDRLEMTRIDDHWRKTPDVETLIVYNIPDASVKEAMLRAGDADIGDVPLRNLPTFTQMGFELLSAGAGSFHTITFSGNYWDPINRVTGEPITERPTYVHALFPWIGDPTRDTWGSPPEGMTSIPGIEPAPFTSMTRAQQVRHALAMAIDRDTINEVLFAGAGWPNYVYAHDVNNENYQDKWVYPYNPAEAERLLDEAGYPRGADGVRFGLPFFIRLGRGDEEIGTAVAGMWREIGMDVQEFRAMYQVFRPQLVSRTATSAWIHSAGASEPQIPWDWPQVGTTETSLGRGGFNLGVELPVIADLYLQMAAEPDKAKRIDIRNQMAQYFWETAVCIGTAAVPQVGLMNPNKIESWETPLHLRENWQHHPENIVLK